MSQQSKMFAALLKYWRGKRGLSQLDLALKADISTRHISFLETSRSQPSQDMVLRLADTLDLPLREQNKLLCEAGFEAAFAESNQGSLEDPAIKRVLQFMMDKQEPYPLLVMDRNYRLVSMNKAATRFLAGSVGDVDSSFNVMKAIFEEQSFKPHIENWDSAAREVLSRLQREVLQNPADSELTKLLESILALPGIPSNWRIPDLSRGSQAVFPFQFRLGSHRLEFITTITSFNTPKNVTLEELQIECYYPGDEKTEELCRTLLSEPS